MKEGPLAKVVLFGERGDHMKKPVTKGATLALGLSLAAGACAAQTPTAIQSRPQLVVLIAVDQMRGDLVDRYAGIYTGGFRRFLDHGYRFSVASHAHANTETAAGHATISTGVFPSRSGIVSNNWDERTADTWAPMYALGDSLSPVLGVEGMPGRSPKNLLRSGLADWVLAADPQARAVSLSSKDRAAITLAGHSRAETYWIAPTLARFVTSTYYRSAYPDWVTRFNETRMLEIVADSAWIQSVPESQRGLARPDSAAYEYDGIHTAFPHLAWLESDSSRPSRNAWALGAQPRADRAVQLLAQEAVKALDLGQRGRVDYLGLSFSSTDYVGHAFGPYSQEQLENLMHLDRQLGELFAFLDREVGEGRWVAGLTADHGVMTMPEHLVSSGEDLAARRIDPAAVAGGLQAAVTEATGAGGSYDQVAERLARLVEQRGLVAKAYTHRELTVGEPADSFATFFRNSYYPGRAAGDLSRLGVEVRFGYHHLVSRLTGTAHGSVYWYDRYVPFLLLGAGVHPGSSGEAVYTVDLAPTLAGLAAIPAPGDLDGKPVYR
ncbi:MAG: alkaline phosphatase family protein [Bacillota bacterium]|nr:alkaline phosphatase family protein [Bacillota bacterium]